MSRWTPHPDLFAPRPLATLPATAPDGALCMVGANIHPRHAWGRVDGAWACTRCGLPMPEPAKILVDTVRGK